jgi:hypothetical protein
MLGNSLEAFSAHAGGHVEATGKHVRHRSAGLHLKQPRIEGSRIARAKRDPRRWTIVLDRDQCRRI